MSKSIVLETMGPCLLFLEEQRAKSPYVESCAELTSASNLLCHHDVKQMEFHNAELASVFLEP